MPYTLPSKAQFTAIYPAFAAVEDAAYTHWSTEALRRISHLEGCLGDGMNTAAMLAIAHLLTKAGIGTGTDAQMAAQGASGFKSMRSGSLSLERFDNAVDKAGGDWGTTTYGAELWPMLRACVGVGPIVSSTGSVCVSGSPYSRGW